MVFSFCNFLAARALRFGCGVDSVVDRIALSNRICRVERRFPRGCVRDFFSLQSVPISILKLASAFRSVPRRRWDEARQFQTHVFSFSLDDQRTLVEGSISLARAAGVTSLSWLASYRADTSTHPSNRDRD